MVNQYKILSAELQNFDRAVEAADASLNSENSTMKQNAEYQKGLEYSVSQLKAQFEEFVLGDGGLQATAKIFLDLVTGTLSLINTLGGLKTVLITIVGIIATVKVNSILDFCRSLPILISNITTNINGFAVAFANARAEGMAFGASTEAALNAVGVSASAAQLAIGALTLAITAGIAIYSAYEAHQEKIMQEALESSKAFKEEASALIETRDALENENISRSELATALEKTIDGYDAEGKSLDELNSKRQEAIDKINEQIATEAKEWNRKSGKQASDALGRLTESSEMNSSDFDIFVFGRGQSAAFDAIEKMTVAGDSLYEMYGKLGTRIDELSEKEGNLTKAEEAELGKLEEYYSLVSDQISQDEKLAETKLYYDYVLNGTSDSLDKYNKFCEESVNYQDNVIKSTDALDDVLTNIEKDYGYTKEQLIEYAEANDMVIETADDWYDVADAMLAAGESAGVLAESVEQVNSLGDTLSKLESDYDSLSAAIADFNDGNGISAANLDKLIELAREHADAISFDNGQIHLNEEAFQASANAAINDAEAKLIDETQSRLTAVAQNNLGEALNGMGNAATNAGAKSDSARVIIQALGDDAVISAAKIRDLWNALDGTNTAGYSKDQKKAVEEIGNYFTTAMNGMEAYRKQISTSYSKAASGSAKASKGAAKESKDAWLEAYKEEKDAIDSMYKTGVINSEEYSAKLQELAEKYFLDSEEHQEKYSKELRSLYEDMYKALQKAAKESLDEMKDAHKKAEDAMKKTHKAQEENLKKAHDTEERLLKKAHEAQEKAIKDQIELLKRQKDAVKDSYDAQIEALKREREEYENQLKLMQLKEELAKAQQQYQYVMDETGRFNYLQDQNAVDKAQEELYEQELKLTYERQLQDLEDARDAAVSVYEQQIQDLEDYYDRVKEINDEIEEELKLRNDEAEEELKRHNEAQEEALSAHNDETEKLYEKAIENYDTYAEMMANGQLSQIANENANWATRLTNLASFVNNYNALLNKMGDGSTGNSASGSFSGGTGYTKNSKSSGSSTKKAVSTAARAGASAINKALGRHAMGIAAIDTDEIALVGDSPNQELAIGSKINGIPLSMDKGSGVVNAKSTRTLAGLLNSIPNLGNNYNTTNNSNQQSIHIDNINLPQVQNGSEFINYLKNFDLDMVQLSF